MFYRAIYRLKLLRDIPREHSGPGVSGYTEIVLMPSDDTL